MPSDAAIFQIEIVGEQRVAHGLFVAFHQPGLAQRKIAQQRVEALAEGLALERNFVEAIVRDDEFQQRGVIFGAAGAEGNQHRASLFLAGRNALRAFKFRALSRIFEREKS